MSLMVIMLVGLASTTILITYYFSWFPHLAEHYGFEVYDIELKWNGVKSYGFFKLWNTGRVDIVRVKLIINGNVISWDRVVKKGFVAQFYIEDLGVKGVCRVDLEFEVTFANNKSLVKVYRSRVVADIIESP